MTPDIGEWDPLIKFILKLKLRKTTKLDILPLRHIKRRFLVLAGNIWKVRVNTTIVIKS